jgi:hypothetical protein
VFWLGAYCVIWGHRIEEGTSQLYKFEGTRTEEKILAFAADKHWRETEPSDFPRAGYIFVSPIFAYFTSVCFFCVWLIFCSSAPLVTAAPGFLDRVLVSILLAAYIHCVTTYIPVLVLLVVIDVQFFIAVHPLWSIALFALVAVAVFGGYLVLFDQSGAHDGSIELVHKGV